ncbi:MAG: MerR family transcriptional regulator [Solirubrobacteraceae bacterium]|nr:MerR family transcriptional regulator [Solirubrobacteraceae bacterium]
MSASYPIGEVARRFGLSPSALRFYESIGLLPEPARVSGRRRYGDDTVEQLAVIAAAQRAGFTLQEAALLLEGLRADVPPADAWRALAQSKLDELDTAAQQIDEMRAMLRTGLSCDCLDVDDIDAFRARCVAWARASGVSEQVE